MLRRRSALYIFCYRPCRGNNNGQWSRAFDPCRHGYGKAGGKGFYPKKKEGDRVKKGELLLEFDLEMITKEGFFHDDSDHCNEYRRVCGRRSGCFSAE